MVTSGYGPHTAGHGCTLMVWSNNSQDSTLTLYDVCTGIVWAPHENLQCLSYPTGPYEARAGPHVSIDIIRICKNPAQASYVAVRGPYGTLTSPHRLFTGCLRSLNPYVACKLRTHALKLYGPCMGRQNSYGAALGPHRPHEWKCNFCSKQAGNSPYVPGSVMWLGHCKSNHKFDLSH